VGEAHGRTHAIAFAHALGAEWRVGRGCFEMQNKWCRYFRGRRQQVVSERTAQERAVRGVGIFFVKGGAGALRETAGDLPRNHTRMQHAAAIVHGYILVNSYGASYPVDLDAAKIENETVAER